MEHGLYNGVSAMRSAEQRLTTIASNLANASTTGFKRRAAATGSFSVGEGPKQRQEILSIVQTDFSQGLLEQTGRKLDLALYGDGFFAAETPGGEAYTRNGRMHMTDQGVLITGEGYPVAWDGPRGTLDPVGLEIAIDDAGNVRQGNELVGKLRIVDFEHRPHLQQRRDGYYTPLENQREIPSEAVVHQGAIERSNASSIEELVALITVQRRFEASSNMVDMIKRSYERFIQQQQR